VHTSGQVVHTSTLSKQGFASYLIADQFSMAPLQIFYAIALCGNNNTNHPKNYCNKEIINKGKCSKAINAAGGGKGSQEQQASFYRQPKIGVNPKISSGFSWALSDCPQHFILTNRGNSSISHSNRLYAYNIIQAI
jgi:hypothetical protein